VAALAADVTLLTYLTYITLLFYLFPSLPGNKQSNFTHSVFLYNQSVGMYV